MRQRILLAILASLAAFTLFAADFPAVGAPAPDFKLMNDQGKESSLKDFRGQWVVLYFYPKDFTSGCTIQARNFQRDLAKYQERKAVIVGVSLDSADSHKEFCAKEGLNFRLLADTDAKVSTAYNSLMEHEGQKYSARNTFLIDPQGKIARVFVKAKPASNSEEVLAAIDELRKPAAK